jgi:phosphoribosylformylglycinamidine synthase subunit PurQ / glutaminase
MEGMSVRALIITGYGINADYELAEAFRQAGSKTERVHINDLIADTALLRTYHILAFPGGFSFGDHISSGLIFANLCKKHLFRELNEFRDAGKLLIGICNGFQVLVKMGILPNSTGSWEQEVSLVHNAGGEFIDTWVTVEVEKNTRSVWTEGVETIDLPVRHGEGRFIVENTDVLDRLEHNGNVALRYSGNNPNGSVNNIAGITDGTGRIFGLMPHPEAFLVPQNHPRWVRDREMRQTGLVFFKNAVEYVRKNLII